MLGLVLVAPLLSTGIDHASDRASEAGAGVILDAQIQPTAKLRLGLDIAQALEQAPRAEVPDFRPAFATARDSDPRQGALLARVEDRLGNTVRAVVERGFRPSFWALRAARAARLRAARLARAKGNRVSARRRGLALLALALVASGALVASSLARGGYGRGDVHLANPCHPRAPLAAGGTSGTIQRIVLDGLDGGACTLRVSRERLVVGLASERGAQTTCSARAGRRTDRVEQAIRAGLRRSIDEAASRGEVGGLELRLLRAATDHLPIAELMQGYQAIS